MTTEQFSEFKKAEEENVNRLNQAEQKMGLKKSTTILKETAISNYSYDDSQGHGLNYDIFTNKHPMIKYIKDDKETNKS